MAGLTDPFLGPDRGQFVELPKQKRGGMFGGGGVGNFLANFALNYAAGMGNQGAANTLERMHQNKMLQQRQAMDEHTYQQHRQDSLADYEAKQQIDARYPTPAQPTEYERMLAAAGITPGSPDYLKHVQAYVSMKENPIVMTPYGPMPYSAVTAPQQVAKPVGKITPIEEGGPSLGGSGMFP